MPPKEKDLDEKVTYSFSGIDNWVPDPAGGGTVDTMNIDFDVNYDLNQMNFDFEGNLRKKYPALNDAWEHYQNIKQMCETREKEEDGS